MALNFSSIEENDTVRKDQQRLQDSELNFEKLRNKLNFSFILIVKVWLHSFLKFELHGLCVLYKNVVAVTNCHKLVSNKNKKNQNCGMQFIKETFY